MRDRILGITCGFMQGLRRSTQLCCPHSISLCSGQACKPHQVVEDKRIKSSLPRECQALFIEIHCLAEIVSEKCYPSQVLETYRDVSSGSQLPEQRDGLFGKHLSPH